METEPSNHKKELVTGLIVLIVIAGIVAGVSLSAKKASHSSSDSKTTSQSSSTTTSASDATITAASYKDGSYTATGSYDSPGGNEDIAISVTLKDGVVTATSAKAGATDREAEEYQSQFIEGYKSLVVGKKIDSLSLNRVSGSSLTSQGFNDAIDKIKNQAKA